MSSHRTKTDTGPRLSGRGSLPGVREAKGGEPARCGQHLDGAVHQLLNRQARKRIGAAGHQVNERRPGRCSCGPNPSRDATDHAICPPSGRDTKSGRFVCSPGARAVHERGRFLESRAKNSFASWLTSPLDRRTRSRAIASFERSGKNVCEVAHESGRLRDAARSS